MGGGVVHCHVCCIGVVKDQKYHIKKKKNSIGTTTSLIQAFVFGEAK
jgi:hypothetical protein